MVVDAQDRSMTQILTALNPRKVAVTLRNFLIPLDVLWNIETKRFAIMELRARFQRNLCSPERSRIIPWRHSLLFSRITGAIVITTRTQRRKAIV